MMGTRRRVYGESRNVRIMVVERCMGVRKGWKQSCMNEGEKESH